MKLLAKLKRSCEWWFDRLCDKKISFSDSSTVTRFINSKKHRTRNHEGKMTATSDAFIYPETEQELSLAHIDGLQNGKIWTIGDKRVFRKACKGAIARADMNVAKLKDASFKDFSIIRDNAEFWRHVTAKATMNKLLWATKLSMLAELVEKK